MLDDFSPVAQKYADDVCKGRIPAGELTVLACRRHLNDLKRAQRKSYPYRFSKAKANRVCNFISRLRHIKGKWAGKEIKLEPWQVFFLSCIFGWERKSDGNRRFREAYLEVARKNAKSTIAAGIGLYMFVEDGEPGAEVYSGATTEKQAWEVFGPARLMAKQAEDFKEHYNLFLGAQVMYVEDSASKFAPIVGNPGDGSSPHCSITDEYHEHKTSAQYDAMITGMGARSQPLELIITTAGSNISGPCYQKRDQIIKILKGVFEEDEVFGVIYTLDEEDKWDDFRNWHKANPNLGVSVFEDYLLARLREAKNNVSRQNIIRCKHLNQWMNASTAWMDMDRWRRCCDPTLSIEDFLGQNCVIALDLATRIDIAVSVKLFEREGHYYLFGNYFVPEETVELPQNDNYRRWVAEGWMTQTAGNTVDFPYIREALQADLKRFRVDEIAYDPYQATQLALEMANEGAPMLEYRNTVPTMSEPMKEMQALVHDQRLHHNGDPVMTWMMSNVVARVDAKENIFPRKEINENKIDGVVAAIMAMGVAIKRQDVYLRGYENGIVFF